MMNPDLKRNNLKAFAFLASPLIIAGLSIYLFMLNSLIWYWLGTLLLSVFFAQTFILLHECGHLSYFENRIINKFFGHIFGLLTVIPFYNWQQIHNLHHKWTGWRDLDPTTEKTAKPVNSKITRFIVNFCWWLFIPLFYLTYKLSNYWNLFKIKRFVPSNVLTPAVINVSLYFLFYVVIFYLFSTVILQYILPAFVLSLVWKELLIMTQHTHIEIPVSEGKDVKHISYMEQVKYTRSFYPATFIARYFLFNFNLHEVHHAYPGLPAYYLDKIDLDIPKKPKFSEWLIKAKSMKGADYIFKTSKQTGKIF
jgi:acyl-lipid omega-6 desaturase (Delta-12 desaturase)